MEEQDKELLLKDLCARLPYGVKCDWNGKAYELVEIDIKRGLVYIFRYDWIEPTYLPYSIPRGDEIKPYLRPMSSMTEEELKEFTFFASISMHRFICSTTNTDHWYNNYEEEDWLNKKMFDYRGLIPMGLALPAPESMYNK